MLIESLLFPMPNEILSRAKDSVLVNSTKRRTKKQLGLISCSLAKSSTYNIYDGKETLHDPFLWTSAGKIIGKDGLLEFPVQKRDGADSAKVTDGKPQVLPAVAGLYASE